MAKHARIVHGFDFSQKSIDNFIAVMGTNYDGHTVYAEASNFCLPMNTGFMYDLVILDWFVYLVSDEALNEATTNETVAVTV